MTCFVFCELELMLLYLAVVIFAFTAFLEFLTVEKAQHPYGEMNFENPVNLAVSVNGELTSWGRFKPDSLPIERLAAPAPKAQMIFDRVGC